MTRAIRGAVQLQSNTVSAMRSGVVDLLKELLRVNELTEDELVSIIFSQTEDLDADNPARCARTVGFGAVPLFCTQEPRYPNSLERVVRVLMTAERDVWSKPMEPIYLGGATALRPDLQTR